MFFWKSLKWSGSWSMIHDPDQNLKDRLTLPNGRCIMWENFRKICVAVSEELIDEEVATRWKIIITRLRLQAIAKIPLLLGLPWSNSLQILTVDMSYCSMNAKTCNKNKGKRLISWWLVWWMMIMMMTWHDLAWSNLTLNDLTWLYMTLPGLTWPHQTWAILPTADVQCKHNRSVCKLVGQNRMSKECFNLLALVINIVELHSSVHLR